VTNFPWGVTKILADKVFTDKVLIPDCMFSAKMRKENSGYLHIAKNNKKALSETFGKFFEDLPSVVYKRVAYKKTCN